MSNDKKALTEANIKRVEKKGAKVDERVYLFQDLVKKRKYVFKNETKADTVKNEHGIIDEEFGVELDDEVIDAVDYFVVAFSGGKDSVAMVLHLLDIGVPKEKIELWHHDVDGREGSNLMDWPVTRDYCIKFAKAFDLPLYFSWRIGGFEGEMMKKDRKSFGIKFEVPSKNGIELIEVGAEGAKVGTRLKWPAKSSDLRTRWCSSYLKETIMSRALNHQERFLGKIVITLTGERAEESTNRSRYFDFELGDSFVLPSTKWQPESETKSMTTRGKSMKYGRYHFEWRPILRWDENEVWDIFKKYRVRPHPAYILGWGRVSCMACIFGNNNQWASYREINPDGFKNIKRKEKLLDHTITHRQPLKAERAQGITHVNISVDEMADKGKAYSMSAKDKKIGMSEKYSQSIILKKGEKWKVPQGAFGDKCGPT